MSPSRRRALLVGSPAAERRLRPLVSRVGCLLERWRGGDSITAVAARYALLILAGGVAPDDLPSVCAGVRAADPAPLVVVLVEREALADAALAADPDEVFVADPPRVIERRLRRLLEVPPLELRPESQALIVDGEEKHLTPLEFAIMELLFRERRAVVSDATLLAHAWGDATTSVSRLYFHVSNLHQKLGSHHASRLARDSSGGYRLMV